MMTDWVAAHNYAIQTGDCAEAFKYVSNKAEEYKFYKYLEGLYKRGGWVIEGLDSYQQESLLIYNEDEKIYRMKFRIFWGIAMYIEPDGKAQSRPTQILKTINLISSSNIQMGTGPLLAVAPPTILARVKMNRINKNFTLICILALSISAWNPIFTHAEECTISEGHCYEVSTLPERRGKTGDKNKEDKSEIPKDDPGSSISINDEYFDYNTWFKNNYREKSDENGAKMHARTTPNHPGEAECYTDDQRPGKYAHTREKQSTQTT